LTLTKTPHISDEHKAVIERLKAWIDEDVLDTLARTGQVKVEVNIKGSDVRANVTGFYQVE